MISDNAVPRIASYQEKIASTVATYESVSEAADIDILVALLADDVTLVSPLLSRAAFRGRDDVRVLMTAIYNQLQDLRWTDSWTRDTTAVLRGEAKIGPLSLDDLTMLEFDDEGRITRIRPHLRPLSASILLLLALGARLARQPRVALRSLRG